MQNAYNQKIQFASIASVVLLVVVGIITASTTNDDSAKALAFSPLSTLILVAVLSDIRVLGFPKYGYALITLCGLCLLLLFFPIGVPWVTPLGFFILYLLLV